MLVFSLAVIGCDDDGDPDAGPADAGPPDMTDAGFDAGEVLEDAGVACDGPPGLYEDDACTVVAAGVRAYTPRFALWSDDADKERYIYLPPGETIDATDPDNWVFPVGTRLYKTFLQGGVRLETRVFEKTDPGTGLPAWDMSVYAWNAEQTAVEDVTNAPADQRENVLGTEHDIPDGALCVQCHNGTLDLINGFGAIMLRDAPDGLSLQTLLDENLLDPPFAATDADVPGSPDEQEALGYLHANCGNCHHEPIDGRGCGNPGACGSGFFLWLDTGLATVQDSGAHTTGVNVASNFRVAGNPAVCRIHPANPDSSVSIVRMEARGDINQMPPVASEQVHAAGVALLRSWITNLSETPSAVCAP